MKLKSLGGLRNTGEGASIKVLANDGLKISDKGLMLIGGYRGESRVDIVTDTESETKDFYIMLTSRTDDKDAGGYKVAKTGQLNSKSICELLGGKGASYIIEPTPIAVPVDEEDASAGTFNVFKLTANGILSEEEVAAEAAGEEDDDDTEANEASDVDASAPRRRASAE